MNVDVPGGLWLVALAATAVVTIIACVGVMTSPERSVARTVIAVLLAWLAVDVALGALGTFAASPTTWVPFIALGIAVPIVAGVALLTRPGAVQDFIDSIPLQRLIGVQVYRAAGVIFLIAWASGRMPGVFALPAGIGDIAVGVAAPFVAARVRSHLELSEDASRYRPANDVAGDEAAARARRTAIAWNLFGIADLVVAVTLGFLSSPSHFQLLASDLPNALISRMPYVLIPTFAVPLSILLHIAALGRLRARGSAPARATVGTPTATPAM